MTESEFRHQVQQKFPPPQAQIIIDALEFATTAHQGQKRKSGESYIHHPIATAGLLMGWKMDVPTIVAGLLHDVPEDTDTSIDDVKQLFGTEVAFLVSGVTKLGKLKYRGLERYVENLRKMFVAMAQDIRVMIIKFADRINNLQTLDALPRDKQLRIARESLEIYAPLAHRLGMGEVKGQLEDLAFPYVHPKEYAWVMSLVGPRYAQLDGEVQAMLASLRERLAEQNVNVIDLHGRRKHLYSLYEKLLRPEYQRDITKISDLLAMRLVVGSVADCYEALGSIHQLWRPVPGRFKDYIAQPKPNGYQSLHTTVFGPGGKQVEVQIRDLAMHQAAEFGVAAHWHYTEQGKPLRGSPVEERLSWINDLSTWHQDYESEEQYLEALKIDAFRKRIFCLTPKGDVIDLPEGATPIDFAYHVHSDLGDRCVGARINDKLSSLDTELKSGDVVEIMIDKNRKRPNRDWLEFARTQAARSHIKRALRENPSN